MYVYIYNIRIRKYNVNHCQPIKVHITYQQILEFCVPVLKLRVSAAFDSAFWPPGGNFGADMPLPELIEIVPLSKEQLRSFQWKKAEIMVPGSKSSMGSA